MTKADVTFDVIVEIIKGSRNKYEFDPRAGRIRFDRMLFSSVHYPSDYGFIPDTLGGDGDPLDALVFVTEPTFPGCMIRVKPVGLFRMWDEKGPDEKLLCVPVGDPLWNEIENLEDLPHHLLLEIENFFRIYKELEKKKTGIEGFEDREAAIRVHEAARARYEESAR